MITCPECSGDGSGVTPDGTLERCSVCHGIGETTIENLDPTHETNTRIRASVLEQYGRDFLEYVDTLEDSQ